MDPTMDEIVNFAIITQSSGGLTLQTHQPDSAEYTYLAHAITIAMGILQTPRGQDALISLAIEFDECHSDGKLFYGDREKAKQLIDLFLSKLYTQFPAIVIDHGITDPNLLAFVARDPWAGSFEDFDPRLHMVHLHPQKVQDMLDAAANLEDRSPMMQFQFFFAVLLVHEVGGHLLISFLSNGDALTPLRVGPPAYTDPRRPVGESGRALEMKIFGGCVEFLKAAGHEHDAGVAHIYDEQGRLIKVQESVGAEIFHHQFQLPLRTFGKPVRHFTPTPGAFTAGRYRSSVSALTAAVPSPPIWTIRDDSQMRQLLAGYNVRVGDVYLAARDPIPSPEE